MPSSSASATSHGRKSVELDYEGQPIFCNCRARGNGVKAAKWTSWTEGNPGIRFYGCANYEVSIYVMYLTEV